MTTIYQRLNITFTNFGEASNLSPGAANSLKFIAENTPPIEDWQKTDLAAGNIQKTDYFQNPMVSNVTTMSANATIIENNASLVGDAELVQKANNLIIELSLFREHTDNLSGANTVTSPNVPAYDTASSVGQQLMMILAKTDGTDSVQNTAPILGSFTSLFIRDEMKSNNEIIGYYANVYASNTESYGEGYTNNLSAGEIANIKSYLQNTTTQLYTRRTEDIAYYLNSVQVMEDYGYLQQFTNAGATNTYLMKNVVGTQRLANNLSSNT